MNKQRRKEIGEAVVLMLQAKELLETVRDEEQEYYDNMPEGLQQGDKGSTAEDAIDNLESAVSDLKNAISSAENSAE